MKADRDITLLAVQQVGLGGVHFCKEPSLLAECHHRSDAEVVLAAAQKERKEAKSKDLKPFQRF